MFENESLRLPTVYVTARDRSRLQLLLAARHRFIPDPVRADLRRELVRAVVCDENDIPGDVVTMNSRALFRADPGGELQSRTLIYDEDHSSVGGTISVVTAAGAALLGLREGSRMPYVTRDGERRVLVLERVAYQPEAQSRVTRGPYRRWPNAGARGSIVPLRTPAAPHADRSEPDDSGPDAA
jgi:regulator of nucleoside diphosphate kinase